MNAPRPSQEMLEDAAARWVMRREEAGWSTGDDAEFAAWLELSDAHRAAFWRLDYGWRAADRVGALGVPDQASQLRKIRRKWTAAKRAIDRHRLKVAAVVSLAAIVALWQIPLSPDVATSNYQTSVGGKRMITLADGSKVEMNTRTRVLAARSADTREVWLEDGEAFFDIVHDPSRTFLVHVGSRTITVLGTRFLVRKDGDKMTVAVVSGRVRVDEPDALTGQASTTTIPTGSVAIVRPNSTRISAASPANIEALTAWRGSQIVFDETPVSAAVNEFNRYTDRPIVIQDAVLGQVRIGGTFRTNDSASFISLLHKAYGVKVKHEANAVVLIHDPTRQSTN